MHPFSLRFWIPKTSFFGPNLEPSWNHLGPQFRFKTAQEASQTPPRGLPDPPWSHLGSQIRFNTAQEASGTPQEASQAPQEVHF